MGLGKRNASDVLWLRGSTFNALAEAANRVRNNALSAPQHRRTPKAGGDSCVITVRNDSGEVVPRFGILGLGDVLFEPDGSQNVGFMQGVAFKGEMPADTHAGKFVVCLEAIPVDGLGAALLAGAIQCQCSFSTGDETAADVLADDVTQLLAGSGSAQIIWSPGETGTQLAIVRLGPPAGSAIQYGITDTECSQRSSCFVIPLDEFYEESGQPREEIWDAHLATGEVLEAGTTVHYMAYGSRKQIVSAGCKPHGSPGGYSMHQASGESYQSQNQSLLDVYSGGGGQASEAVSGVFDPSIFSGVTAATLA